MLFKKNLKNSKDLEVDNLVINQTISGSYTIPPSQIQTSPPSSLTVNEISKLIGVQGSLVDSNTANQQIFAKKIFNESFDLTKTSGSSQILINNTNGAAVLNITGFERYVTIGPNYFITTNQTNPESFRIYRNPTVSFFDFNNISGCLSIGDNNGSSGLNYLQMNIGSENKTIKLPFMNNAQQSTYVAQLTGGSYGGSLFFNSQNNRLCFTDSNDILHQINGTTATSTSIINTDNEFVIGNSVDQTKAMKFDCSALTTATTRTITVPDENIILCSTNTSQTISGKKYHTNYLNMELGQAIALRDNNDNFFLHNISYDGTRNFNIKFALPDEGSGYSGLEVGYHQTNIKTNPFIQKFAFLSDNNANNLTTVMNIDTINFLSKGTASLFNVNNLNQLNIGTSPKIGSIRQDASQGNTTYITYLPTAGNVELKNLEGVTSNVQTQLSDKVSLSVNETITSEKTFETAINNTQVIKIKSTTGSIVGLSFENASSPAKIIINKNVDNLSFVNNNVERMVLQSDDLNLSNGGNYLKNGTEIRLVSETMQNKTLSFSENTFIGVVSTSTSQTVSGIKNFSGANNLLVDNEPLQKSKVSSNPPTTSDDINSNYLVGSTWYCTGNKSSYTCIDNSSSVARWVNNNRREISFSYFSTTSDSYLPFTYIYSGDTSFNKLTVTTYADADGCKVQLYNITSSVSVVESNTIPTGTQTTVINIPSSPLTYSPNTFFRLEIKSITNTQTSAAFCASLE